MVFHIKFSRKMNPSNPKFGRDVSMTWPSIIPLLNLGKRDFFSCIINLSNLYIVLHNYKSIF